MEKHKSLEEGHPELASEWHPVKNGELTPEMVTCHTHRKVWWSGKCGHEWEARISHRFLGVGCPICGREKSQRSREKNHISAVGSLQDNDLELASQWHPTLNGELAPEMVTAGSRKKVWWLCEKGHEWQAVIGSRYRGAACPICSNQRVMVGYNDLASQNPRLASEWHPTLNGKLTPEMITQGSNKKVWWLGTCGHAWEATISKRSIYNRGCPYCTHEKVLVGYNDLASQNPKLASEWHPTQNGKLTPLSVMSKSNKKVWWLGKCGHEWRAVISSRTAGYGCPVCANKMVLARVNDMATVAPELAEEWHPTKNGTLTPNGVVVGSNRKVWWLGKCGHEWEATIDSRYRGQRSCPYCAGAKILLGFNDLGTTDPTLAREWHPRKNGDLLPTMVMAGSNRKVWWKCEKNHVWKARIYSRSAGSGCPECAKEHHTSFPEQAVFYFLKMITDAENRNRCFGKEIDIWLPQFQIGIEYNGWWHNNRTERDAEKTRFFADKGIRIITIKEGTENRITGDIIEYIHKANHMNLEWAIKELFSFLLVEAPEINVAAHEQEIFAQYIQAEKDNSLALQYPALIPEWHTSKNHGLRPEQVAAKSNKKVYWKCKQCGHEWATKICHRTCSGSGCPVCNKRRRKNGESPLNDM